MKKKPKPNPILTPAFYPDQSTLVSGLRVVSKSLCSYGGGVRCDCKYGVGKQERVTSSESGCGCPETAAAAAIVEVLSPREFERLVKRAQRARSPSRRKP